MQLGIRHQFLPIFRVVLAIAIGLSISPLRLHAEEGGGGSGALAGALIAVGTAAGQIGAAAAQAHAQVATAGIEAGAAVAQTGIKAGTDKYLSDNQASISETNNIASYFINRNNNETQTNNLEAMLDFNKWSRALDAEWKKQKSRDSYEKELVGVQLEREIYRAKIVQQEQELQMKTMLAGLSTGITKVAGSTLTTTKTFNAQAAAVTTEAALSTRAAVKGVAKMVGKQVKKRTASARLIPKFMRKPAQTAEMKSLGSALTGLFSSTLATGSSRQMRKRSDLESFHEQGHSLAMSEPTAIDQVQEYPRHVASDRGFETTGKSEAQGHAAVARPASSSRIRTVGGGVAEE